MYLSLSKQAQKYLIFSSIFITCLNFTTFGQKQQRDIQQVRAILARQEKAWNQGQIDEFMVGYWPSDSLMYMGKSGIKYGYNTTLSNYKKNYPDRAAMGALTFNLKKVEPLSRKVIFVVGSWHLARPQIGDIGGYFSLIFRKIHGQWYITSDHSS